MSGLDEFEAFANTLTLENGKRLVLEDWQKVVLTPFFEGVPETLLLIGKKAGKSTMCSVVALFHLLTTPGADVLVVAASREQAALVTEQCAGLVRRSGLSKRIRVLGVGRELRGLGAYAGRRIKVLPADPRTADGVRPSLAIIDELHRHPSSELYSVIRDGLPALGGQLISISTAGEYENPDADDPHSDPLARLRLAARALPLERPYPQWRLVTARSESFAFFEFGLWEGDSETDFETVKMACPQASVTVEDLRRRHASQSMMAWQWSRWVCNKWVGGSEDSVFSSIDWNACADPDVVIPNGSHVWIGLDCARIQDTTAIVPVWERSPGELVTCDAVVLRPPGDGSQLPVSEIVPTIVAMAKRWDIEVVFDPAAAGGLIGEELDRLGVSVVQFAQAPAPLAEASELLRGLVVNRHIVHDANPVVSSHILASVQRSVGAEGWRIAKPKRGGRHVDAAQALSWACWVALLRPTVDEPFIRFFK
jgi:phage terminase large subunit-like protein